MYKTSIKRVDKVHTMHSKGDVVVRNFISRVGKVIGIVAIALALFYKPFRDWINYSHMGTWYNCVEQPAGHLVCDEGEITIVRKGQ